MPAVEDVAALLIDIEAGLRQLSLWDAHTLSEEALTSTEPFGIDTMTFAQWLQHIFLPTMYGLLESDQALPTECAIAPMASEYFNDMGLPSGELESALAEIDRLLCGG